MKLQTTDQYSIRLELQEKAGVGKILGYLRTVLCCEFSIQPCRSGTDKSKSTIVVDLTFYQDRFYVKAAEGFQSVGIQDVAYFYRQGRCVYLICKKGMIYQLNLSLDQIAKRVSPTHFFQVNRTMIISYDCLYCLELFRGKYQLELKPRFFSKVTVSRERATRFKCWLRS
jgi:DNA-binding LytR/AlgR family response regulator